jgi:class 3 adenylate cyclase
MTPTRRLAAIMAADVAGFSAAMERDEPKISAKLLFSLARPRGIEPLFSP